MCRHIKGAKLSVEGLVSPGQLHRVSPHLILPASKLRTGLSLPEVTQQLLVRPQVGLRVYFYCHLHSAAHC